MSRVITNKKRYAEYRIKQQIINEQIENLVMQMTVLERKLKRRIKVARALDCKYSDSHTHTGSFNGR